MSIFISIASYRDLELVKTVESIYDNAQNPDDLIFGIVSQDYNNKHPDFSWLGDQLRMRKMLFTEAKGAGYARKIAMELYDEEDYFFQIDSHMRFAKGWDTKLKEMISICQKEQGTDKIILSQFPAPYEIFTDGTENFPIADEDFWSDPSWTSVVNTATGVWAGHREKIENKNKPHYSHTVLGALIFAPGYITKEIPYDERISFMGEELCFAIRAYTRGWHIYAPNEMIAWHFYTRKDRPKIWHDNFAKRSWTNIEMESQRIQKNILLAVEQGTYGVDDYKKYVDYQKMIGINFEEFYASGIIDEKINMASIIEELDFFSPRRTGYCLNGMHSLCKIKQCECKCHIIKEDK
jgi:hypothetical protein